MKQINKRQARKLYEVGKEFWITPCNMRPQCGIMINAVTYEDTFNCCSFDQMYNSFCYYNCDNERGRYPRFYVEE